MRRRACEIVVRSPHRPQRPIDAISPPSANHNCGWPLRALWESPECIRPLTQRDFSPRRRSRAAPDSGAVSLWSELCLGGLCFSQLSCGGFVWLADTLASRASRSARSFAIFSRSPRACCSYSDLAAWLLANSCFRVKWSSAFSLDVIRVPLRLCAGVRERFSDFLGTDSVPRSADRQ